MNTIEEEDDYFFELAIIPKNFTGLPLDLRIHENGSSGDIEFNAGENDWGLMSISENPEILKTSQAIVSEQDINEIKNFITKYKNDLERIMNPKDDYYVANFQL